MTRQPLPARGQTKDMRVFSIKIIVVILFAGIVLVAVAGCQGTASPSTGKKLIVVTYSVLGSIVKDLVGDQVSVTVSIPNGLDPHEWEPSAKDIEKINKADLVVQNGLELESGMQKTLELAKNNGVKVFTASDYIAIRHVGVGEGIPSGDPDQAVGAPDPHLWMDPLNMKSIVAALSITLKTDFNMDVSAQSADLQNRLDKLDKQISDIVGTVPQSERNLVTGHESMGYFASRYGFKLAGVIVPSLSSQAGVSAADLAGLKQVILANRVKAIFAELGTSEAVARTIADETGVQVLQLTTHALPPDGSFFTFMLNLANIIAGALK
jgi:zinc/manganese transport system substrate-binding protein